MKSRLFVLFIGLALPLVPAVSATPPKAGAICAKSGITKDYNGKKYTCIKAGKKLVWNQGVVIKGVAPTPTPKSSLSAIPTPTPIATPTSTPSLTPTPSSTKTMNQNETPIPTPIPVPAEPTSFEDLVQNYTGISYAAWSKSRTKILTSEGAPINLSLVLGPNSKLTYQNPEKAFELVSKLYKSYTKSSQIFLLAFNFDDRDWAVKKMDEIMPNKGSRWIYEVACATKSTCWGGGAFSDGSDKFLIVLTVGYIDNNHTEGTLEAHEFTHVIQQTVMKAGNPWPLFDPWPPTWYWEGQAEFTQNATMWFESYDIYMNRRSEILKELLRNSNFNQQYIKEYFVINGDSEWRIKHDSWRQYDLGSMFVEILTAIRGPDSTMEMWKLAQLGTNFEDAFKQIYGTSFQAALPIIAKAIALQLGR